MIQIKNIISILIITWGAILPVFSQLEHSNYYVGFDYLNPSTYHVQFSDTGIVYQGMEEDYPFFIYGVTSSYSHPKTGDLLLFSDGYRMLDGNFEYIENGDSVYITEYDSIFRSGPSEEYGRQFPLPVHILPLDDTQERFYVIFEGILNEVSSYLIYYGYEVWKEDGKFKMAKEPEFYTLDDVDISRDLRRIHVIRHGNGRDWWIIHPEAWNKMHFFLLSPEGIAYSHMQELPVEIFQSDFPYKYNLQFQEDVDKICWINLQNNLINTAEIDRCAGEFYNVETQHKFAEEELPYGDDEESRRMYVAYTFSPDGRYLYLYSEYDIDQFDLEAQDFYESKKPVINDQFLNRPTRALFNLGFGGPAGMYAPDGKIYIPMAVINQPIGVLDKPHRRGIDAHFRLNGIVLPQNMLYQNTISSGINFTRGPVEGSPCDTLGIDGMVKALFRHDVLSDSGGMVDFMDLSKTGLEEWAWDFDDGNTSSERYPIYEYMESGTYNVCLTVRNSVGEDTYCEDVEINLKTVSTIETITDFGFSVYPNPVHEGRIYINNRLNTQGMVRVIDMQGRVLKTLSLTGSHETIEVSDLPSGMYLVEIATEKGTAVEKVTLDRRE